MFKVISYQDLMSQRWPRFSCIGSTLYAVVIAFLACPDSRASEKATSYDCSMTEFLRVPKGGAPVFAQ